MKRLFYLLLVSLTMFSCKQTGEKIKLPIIISSLEFDTIIQHQTRSINKIETLVYGVSITDSLQLENWFLIDIENYIDFDVYVDSEIRKQNDSLIVIVDASLDRFHSNEFSLISRIKNFPFPYKKTDSTFNEEDNFYDYKYEIDPELMEKIEDCKRTHFYGYPVFIYNSSTQKTIVQKPLDYDLYLFVEAQDKNGDWKPIEYYYRSTYMCGTGHMDYLLKPESFLVSSIKKYHGDYKTNLRVKLKNFDKVYYSNIFKGTINYSQFDKSEVLKDIGNRFKDVDKDYYDFILNSTF